MGLSPATKAAADSTLCVVDSPSSYPSLASQGGAAHDVKEAVQAGWRASDGHIRPHALQALEQRAHLNRVCLIFCLMRASGPMTRGASLTSCGATGRQRRRGRGRRQCSVALDARQAAL